ncbi:MAG: hypothetical protein WAU32_05500 [Thermoanaerobaculia bacterium]
MGVPILYSRYIESRDTGNGSRDFVFGPILFSAKLLKPDHFALAARSPRRRAARPGRAKHRAKRVIPRAEGPRNPFVGRKRDSSLRSE